MDTSDSHVPSAADVALAPAPAAATPAAAAAAALPGVDTLTFLATTDNDLAALTPPELVDAIICSERLLAHLHARQLSLLAELGVPGRCGDVSDLVNALVDKGGRGRRGDGAADGEVDAAEVAEVTADCAVRVAAAEVAAVLDWSPITAKIRINQATRMLTALPATAAALRQGRVDVGRARMITDRTAVLTLPQCGRVERRILNWAKGRSLGQLETLVDREVIAADPAAAENRRIHAVKGRSVGHRPDKDGMGVITALLPAESAVLVFTLIDLIAQAHQGLDGRSIDQRRADVLADIAEELLTHGYLDLDGLIARTHPHHPDNTHPDTHRGVPDTQATDPAAPNTNTNTGDGADTAEPAKDVDRDVAADLAVRDTTTPTIPAAPSGAVTLAPSPTAAPTA
ncbi:hypothetical protein ABIB25_002830, partial [Nakamurella sp. UYEF19]|uniref:DUF222 domain-containing protein n=1 Tax=Nakamurella sp. UYEF19 TaxID=1756392 RepID=UPI003399211B